MNSQQKLVKPSGLHDMMNVILHTLQSESKQRPHKLSYIASVKGDATEKVVSQLEVELQAAGKFASTHAQKRFATTAGNSWLREYA